MKRKTRFFKWTDKAEIWDWSNCTISAANFTKEKVGIIIRSSKTIYSRYRKKNVDLKFMLGVDVSEIHEPREESYNEPAKKNTKNREYGKPRLRWVFQLDSDYWIWEWAESGTKITESTIYQIYQTIKRKKESPAPGQNNVLKIKTNDDDRIIPIIYQPAIDSWKNFIREVHCHATTDDEIEVSLVFNNEQLREHHYLNDIYEWFRSWFYGRTMDIETFKIILKNGIPEKLNFKGIHSGDNGLIQDDIHGDKPDSGQVPLRSILDYYSNTKHPIIFINTSNHAMAEYDMNGKLWKWEYVPWDENSPIAYGNKSRKEIEKSFKNNIQT